MAQLAKDYDSVMGRSNEIMKEALGLDYAPFESGSVAFDYEALMKATNYTIDEINRIQSRTGVGSTPLLELRNITAFARKYAKPGYGARIFVKDEAANASGSFKDRRAACAVAHAKKLGYKGVVAATSGNYGAAVASQAAMQGLECIIVQECYDSKGVGQPEIVEKARKCEALGAEVIQLTVGPELFYTTLSVIEDTGYFNASLYSPYGIAGIETLGYEIAMQCKPEDCLRQAARIPRYTQHPSTLQDFQWHPTLTSTVSPAQQDIPDSAFLMLLTPTTQTFLVQQLVL